MKKHMSEKQIKNMVSNIHYIENKLSNFDLERLDSEGKKEYDEIKDNFEVNKYKVGFLLRRLHLSHLFDAPAEGS